MKPVAAIRNKAALQQFIIAALVLLLSYAATSKLIDFRTYEQQMSRQVFPPVLNGMLAWVLPPVELLTAGLLLFSRTKLAGMIGAVFLMAAFTVYVGLGLLGTYKHVPCSCGGILAHMGWKVHFWFNLFFLLLSSLGIILINRERRLTGN